MLELLEQEILLWDAEDLKCAFYVFGIPEAWWRYFVIGKAIDGEHVGGEPGIQYWLAVVVIPMGWLSAVGVCQYLQRRLGRAPRAFGAELPAVSDLRKDKPAPVCDKGCR